MNLEGGNVTTVSFNKFPFFPLTTWEVQSLLNGPLILKKPSPQSACAYSNFLSPTRKVHRHVGVSDINGMLSKRGSQCFFYGPTFLDSRLEGVEFEPELIGPFGDDFGFSVKNQPDNSTGVPLLEFGFQPYAIIFIVRTIIIFSLKRTFWTWPFAHIGVEIFKLTPPLVIADSPSSIGTIVTVLRIVASFFHSSPRTVGHCVRHSVGSFFFFWYLITKTAAVSHYFHGQVGSSDRNYIFTDTFTLPDFCPRSVFSLK